MELKTTLYEVRDRVAWLTLNRPHRLNTWTGRMHTEYRWALAEAERDERRAGDRGDRRGARVLRGRGHGRARRARRPRAATTRARRTTWPSPATACEPEFDHPFAFQFGMAKPIIAAINGPAAGVGLVLACFADLRFAAAGAKLTTAHGKLGLPAEYGLSWLLPRISGVTRANDLLL